MNAVIVLLILCWRLLCGKARKYYRHLKVDILLIFIDTKVKPCIPNITVALILFLEDISIDGSERILITDISQTTTSDDGQALHCFSELKTTENGDWYLNNMTVEEMDSRGWVIRKSNRMTNNSYLHVSLKRVSDTAVEGEFTCRIDGDSNPSASVGIYYPINSVSATIVLVDREKLFRVNCTSTGGRALSMSVTGPGGFNSDLNSIEAVGDPQGMGDDMFSASTDVISGGRDGDIYQCTASNGVSTDPTNDLELRVASDPTITLLEQISATAVKVEWSQPSGEATVTGYVVHYSDGDTDRNESVAVSSTSYNITDLTSGLTYTISVEATSEQLSGVSDNWNITFGALRSVHGVVVSDVESTSVRVSWQAVEGADRYTVTLSQAMGDDQLGLCREDSHTVSVDTSSLSVVVGQTDDDMLRAYTTYSITVVAESDLWRSSQHSEPINIMTNQTMTAVSPRNVTASVVSSTVVSVQWDGLSPCSQVNGLIVQYRVQYTAESSGVVQSIDQAGEWNITRAEVSLTGLTPYTNYSIQVAAVNEQGDVGLYSDPIDARTAEDTPGAVVITPFLSYFKIFITWDPPDMPNGVIIAYEVSYRPPDSSQSVTTLNTTDLATSFTTQSDLELGTEFIFSVRAYTRVGPGNTTSVKVSTLSQLAALQGVEVSSVNATSVNVSWDILTISHFSIYHYTVVYSLTMEEIKRQDREMSAVFPWPATSGVITDLIAASVYQFQVYATISVNGAFLNGERSSPVYFTTMDQASSVSEMDSGTICISIIIGFVIAVIGVAVGIAGIITSCITIIKTSVYVRSSSGKRSGVTTEDNPAYGVIRHHYEMRGPPSAASQ